MADLSLLNCLIYGSMKHIYYQSNYRFETWENITFFSYQVNSFLYDQLYHVYQIMQWFDWFFFSKIMVWLVASDGSFADCNVMFQICNRTEEPQDTSSSLQEAFV
jgi:hypothetical protein